MKPSGPKVFLGREVFSRKIGNYIFNFLPQNLVNSYTTLESHKYFMTKAAHEINEKNIKPIE